MVKNLSLFVLICLFGAYSCVSKGNSDRDSIKENCLDENKLTVEQMQKDIDFYFTVIKDAHPEPYYKYSEEQIDSVHREIKERCKEPMCINKFKYTIAQANKYIDLHSGISLSANDPVSPGLVSWIDFSDGQMRTDSFFIKEINGVPVSEISKMIDNVISWEYSPRSRQIMKNRFLSRALLNYYGFEIPYKCKAVDLECGKIVDDYILNKEDEISVLSKISNYDTIYHKQLCSQQFFDEESIGVFYYNTSSLYESESQKKLDENASLFFKKVKEDKIKHVFIDVSQNGGGSDNVHKYIMKHLECKPYDMVIIGHNTVKKAEVFAEWVKNDSLPREPIAKLPETNRYRKTIKRNGNKGYSENVYVIMGPWTFSAGYDFCDWMKRGNSSILVGEAAGQHFPFVGVPLAMKLPESGISFLCGTNFLDFEPSITDKSGFLQPDIPYKLDHPMGIDDYKKIIRLNKETK